MALQALFKMKAIDAKDHRLFTRIVDFSQKLSSSHTSGGDQGNVIAEGVISSEFPNLMNGKSLKEFLTSTVEGVKADEMTDLPMRVAVARAMLVAGSGSNVALDASSLILDSKLNVRCVTVETCREALKFTESIGTTKEGGKVKELLMGLIMTKFPFAKDF